MKMKLIIVIIGVFAVIALRAQANDKATLTKVLIIGDSISLGYTPTVVKLLKGKASVSHAPGNNAGTTRGMKYLKSWLGKDKWDVIHFNWGLHDLKHVKVPGTNQKSNNPNDPYQADIKQYEQNMRILVPMLKATGAKLIFATTTPYPAGVKPARIPEDAAKYNAVALEIMNEHGIVINDLYSYALPQLEKLQTPKDVHFTGEGYKALGQEVAKHILKAIGQQENPPDTK